MANLTITVDSDLLKAARIRAAEHGTSVNAILRDELVRFAGSGAATDPVAEFLELARTRPGSSGAGGRDWTRDELHLERFRARPERDST